MEQLSPIQKKNYFTRIDILNFLLFSILVFLTYELADLIILCLNNAPGFIIMKILVSGFAGMMITVLMFLYINYFSQRQRQQEQLLFEQEKHLLQLLHCNRLIDTLASTHRQFRNKLQVMNMLAEMGKNEALNEYIFNTADEMSRSKAVSIENPVLSAAIVSQKILAKERDINLVISSNTSIIHYAPNLIYLGEVINLILKLFIELELDSQSVTKAVFLDIKDNGYSYLFDFYHNREAIQNFESKKNWNFQPFSFYTQRYQETAFKRFGPVESLLRGIGSKGEYIIRGDVVIQLKFKVKKCGKLLFGRAK